MTKSKKIIVIAGATASGKSSIANDLARKNPSVIINADSQQLYKDLAILTARPSKEDEQNFPHKLYGFLKPNERFSAGEWASAASREIDEAFADDKLPIIVGGTGLYIKTLMDGIAKIPDISSEIKDVVNAMTLPQLQAALSHEDALAYQNIDINNPVRIARALSVIRQTGKSILHWQSSAHKTFYNRDLFEVIYVQIEREELYKRCNIRFDKMIKDGAVEEVQGVLEQGVSTSEPIFRIIGAREIAEHLNGNISLEEASEKAKQFTRNYAKRQYTWFSKNLERQE